MSEIELALDGPVATVTIRRPQRRNALDSATIRQLGAAFAALKRDDRVRAIVLTGAGGAFSAGGDLQEDMAALTPDARMRDVTWAAEELAAIAAPVVAKVDGAAMGAGCSLVLACDLAVASTRATFGLPFASRGLSPDFGASWHLTAALGLRRATALCLLGDRLDAQEAHALGIVQRVVEAEALDAATGELVERLVSAPAQALWRTKRLLRESAAQGYHRQLGAEAAAQALNLHAPDAQRAREDFKQTRRADGLTAPPQE